jgi:hypothetical protein
LPKPRPWRGLCGTDGKGGRRATWAACRVLLDQRKGKSAVRQQLYPSTARMTQVLEALVVVVLVAISKMLEHHAKKKNFLPPTSFERKIVLLAL